MNRLRQGAGPPRPFGASLRHLLGVTRHFKLPAGGSPLGRTAWWLVRLATDRPLPPCRRRANFLPLHMPAERPLCIYVDVDDTLVHSVSGKTIPNPNLVTRVRQWKAQGAPKAVYQ